MKATSALVSVLALLLVLGSWLVAAPAHADQSPAGPQVVATPELGDNSAPNDNATAGPTSTPEGDPARNDNGSVLDILPDPQAWATDVFTQALVTLLQGIAEALRRVVDSVLGSSLNFISQTPPDVSYASPTVQGLWEIVRTIANAALALVALWGGFNLIVRPQIGAPYHEAMELFPRLALGALLVNTSLWWVQLVIDANNALCSAIGEASFPAYERASSFDQVLVDVLATLIYLVTSLFLVLQMLMRLALIDVLLVAAPLGLLCWVLPQTQGWARLWSGTFFTAVFTQAVQVLALKLGVSLSTELAPLFLDSALIELFIGVAMLVLTLRIPGLMRGQLGDGLGFIRYVAYSRGARALQERGHGAHATGDDR